MYWHLNYNVVSAYLFRYSFWFPFCWFTWWWWFLGFSVDVMKSLLIERDIILEIHGISYVIYFSGNTNHVYYVKHTQSDDEVVGWVIEKCEKKGCRRLRGEKNQSHHKKGKVIRKVENLTGKDEILMDAMRWINQGLAICWIGVN